MSPVETNIFRFIFTLDNILVALIPCLKALAAAAIIAPVALFARRIICGIITPAK